MLPLREFLVRQDPRWLADELLRLAQRDPVAMARLNGAAGGDRAGRVDTSRLRRELDSALDFDWRDDRWSGTGGLAGVDAALGRVEELTDAGFPEAAIDVSEYALALLEDAYEIVDDSDGELHSAVKRAEAIHLAACEAARPEPVALAERLARWALRSESEVFLDAVSAYAAVLGADGLARFEELVDERLAAFPELAPGDKKEYGHGRFAATYLKEALAALRGPDAVVEVLARDLSSTYRFLRIAQVLAEADRHDDALDWLARGHAAFPNHTDWRLADLEAELHARAGRHAQAVEIAWRRFADAPSLSTYQRLCDFATAGGTWHERRAAALDLLRGQPAARSPEPAWMEPAGHTTLVEVLQWEGDLDAAWAAAQEGGCTRDCWLALARARAHDHPADAIPILQREVLLTIQAAKRPAYRVGAQLSKELQGYARAAGRSNEFDSWMCTLRADNRRRPALLDELNRARLPR